MNHHIPFQIRVGDIIKGKYRVEKILGQGGMGYVVAARHLTLGNVVAIKIMLPAVLGDAEAMERFRLEAQAIARLKHPNIVAVYDMDTCDNGAPFIAMEYLEGTDLRTLSKRRGIFPLPEACLYVLQACEGLRVAHAHGIIHRDLKPANLFLTTGLNGEPCIKIVDFGIAKLLPTDDQEDPGITRTRMPMGTPLYMSPEQWRSARTVDPRADIWSLGVILYVLSAGVLPWHATTNVDLCTEILGPNDIRPPSNHNPTLPPAFDTVVLCCLEKLHTRRYASMDDVIAALRPFLRAPGTPVQLQHLTSTIVMVEHSTPTLTQSHGATTPMPPSMIPPTRPSRAPTSTPTESETAHRWALTGKNDVAGPHDNEKRKTKVVLALGAGMTLAVGLGIGMAVHSEGKTTHVATPTIPGATGEPPTRSAPQEPPLVAASFQPPLQNPHVSENAVAAQSPTPSPISTPTGKSFPDKTKAPLPRLAPPAPARTSPITPTQPKDLVVQPPSNSEMDGIDQN